MQVCVAELALRRAPSSSAALDTQALHGETVTVFETSDGWAWGQLDRDRYVGYLPVAGLQARIDPPTHRVTALRTFAYPTASIKGAIRMGLSLGAEVAVVDWYPPFAKTAAGDFIWAAHLAPLDAPAPDFVAVAEQFLGTPYLWGGKTSFGIDCSGLAQVSLASAGHFAPRDSGMQEAETGLPIDEAQGLQRGDLLFWKGHVGIMRDAGTLLHAAGHWMTVVSEPLALVRERTLAAGAGPVTAARRVLPRGLW